MFAVWGENKEKLLQAMKKTRDHSVLAPLAEKLEAPNAIHLWREVRSFFQPFHDCQQEPHVVHCAIQGSPLNFPKTFHLAVFTPIQADFTLLFHASVENNPMAFQLVLDNGGDPVIANNRGTNVLMIIMKRSQIDMADMCLAKIDDEERAREFVNSKNEAGWTALMTAAENNQVGTRGLGGRAGGARLVPYPNTFNLIYRNKRIYCIIALLGVIRPPMAHPERALNAMDRNLGQMASEVGVKSDLRYGL